MSVPTTRDRKGPIADLSIRVALPLGVLAVGIAVLLGEQMRVDHELFLVAPPSVGGSSPLRAMLFDRFDAPDGPRAVRAPIDVELVHRGVVRARSTLRPSMGGAEGSITVPSALRGRAMLRARASIGGELVASVERPIELGVDRAATLHDRIAGPLQSFALGELEILGADPPSLDVRVAGSACVPEARCELLVSVRDSSAAVRVIPTRAISVLAGQREGSLALLPIVVHGPEASAEIVAARGGSDVARRSLRVPVALATPAVRLPHRILAPSERPRAYVEALGEHPGVIVDVYREGRWTHTASLARRSGAIPLSLPSGLSRLQVRTDPFSSERSAVRMVVARRPGESPSAALARAFGSGLPPSSPELQLAWAAAPFEQGIYVVPRSVGGRGRALARLDARRTTLRVCALVALVLAIAIAAVLLLRRGLDAARQAQDVMASTGDPELASGRHRRRTLLSALALVATLLLAFLGAAALIVARAHLLE